MNRFSFVVMILASVLIGCSDSSNPLDPARSSGTGSNSIMDVEAGRNPEGGATAYARFSGMEAARLPGGPNFITVTKSLLAADGGTVSMTGSFLDLQGKPVTYDISIMFPAGALPRDAVISISIDTTKFQIDGQVTFGPCGTTFHTPATLTVKATNIDFVKKHEVINFYYMNDGVMEPMPQGWGSYVKKSGSDMVEAGAQVPHFSRYAFGR